MYRAKWWTPSWRNRQPGAREASGLAPPLEEQDYAQPHHADRSRFGHGGERASQVRLEVGAGPRYRSTRQRGVVVLRQLGQVEEIRVAVVVDITGGPLPRAIGHVVALRELGEVEEVNRSVEIHIARKREACK